MRRWKRWGWLVIVSSLWALGCSEDDSGTVVVLDDCEFLGITPLDSQGLPTGPEDPDDWCPEVAVFPNATSGPTTIQFDLSSDQHVRAYIRDVSAGEIRVLIDDDLVQGMGKQVVWDLLDTAGARVANGIYCVTVDADSFSCTGDVQVQ
jgi:hypothetical protein